MVQYSDNPWNELRLRATRYGITGIFPSLYMQSWQNFYVDYALIIGCVFLPYTFGSNDGYCVLNKPSCILGTVGRYDQKLVHIEKLCKRLVE